MSTELTTRSTTVLSITDDQHGFTPDQEAALRQIGVQANSPADVAVFFHQAKRSGLDPFKREIYMITRKGKATIQTGIDGFYKIADRASRANGGTWGIPETLWCGEDGRWRDVWLERQAPSAAKVTVERDGSRFTTVALTREYAAGGPMWDKMPARMIAKCAEALAIRRAFPDDLSGLYTSEEMAQADAQTPRPQVQRPAPPTLGEAMNRPAPAAPQAPMISRDQWEQIAAALAAVSVTEFGDQLKAASDLAGRAAPIQAPQELTAEEATRILQELATPENQTPETAVDGELIDDNTQEG